MQGMKIIRYKVGDHVILKKQHPCGGNSFCIMRVGSDIRILCDTCGRDMTLPREKLEKATKKLLFGEGEDA